MDQHAYVQRHYLNIANCSGSPLLEDVVIINSTSTSSQLTYICNCPSSMMIVKTAVCVGNGTWLPQVSCGGDDCTLGTNSEGNM